METTQTDQVRPETQAFEWSLARRVALKYIAAVKEGLSRFIGQTSSRAYFHGSWWS